MHRSKYRRAAALTLDTRGRAFDAATGEQTTLAERVAAIRATGEATALEVRVPVTRLALTQATRAEDGAAPARTAEGVALVYGVEDSYGTTWLPESIERGTPDLLAQTFPFLWFHYRDEPLGVFRVLRNSPAEGLVIEVTYDETPDGDRALARARSGSAPGLSVGVLIYIDPSDEDWTRIKVAELVEVSQITLDQQAVPGAALTAVRADAPVEGEPETPEDGDDAEDAPEGEAVEQAAEVSGDTTDAEDAPEGEEPVEVSAEERARRAVILAQAWLHRYKAGAA